MKIMALLMVAAPSVAAAVRQIKKDLAGMVTCSVWDGYPYGHVFLCHAIDFLREKTITAEGVLKQ